MTRIIIAGSRSYKDYEDFCASLDPVVERIEKHSFGPLEILTGDCNGTDAMARRYAEEYGYPLTTYVTLPEYEDGFIADRELIRSVDKIIIFRNSATAKTDILNGIAREENIPTVVMQITV